MLLWVDGGRPLQEGALCLRPVQGERAGHPKSPGKRVPGRGAAGASALGWERAWLGSCVPLEHRGLRRLRNHSPLCLSVCVIALSPSVAGSHIMPLWAWGFPWQSLPPQPVFSVCSGAQTCQDCV